MEHVVADHSQLNILFKPLVTSGLAFGATRWLASIVRHIELSESLMNTTLIADARRMFIFLVQNFFHPHTLAPLLPLHQRDTSPYHHCQGNFSSNMF